MINNFNFTADYVVWTFVVEDKRNDQIKVSIRSRGPVINAIANKYNGGGHKLASGCRIKTMEEVDKFLDSLKDFRKNFSIFLKTYDGFNQILKTFMKLIKLAKYTSRT